MNYKYKPYRVDFFGEKYSHYIIHFNDKETAIRFGKQISDFPEIISVFLLEHVIDGKYSPIQSIKTKHS